jgi:predicted transcriptional regulator
MNLVSRTLEIDADTDARLREMATERGQEVAAVLAEAVALLDSVVDLEARMSLRTAAVTTNSSGPGLPSPLMK